MALRTLSLFCVWSAMPTPPFSLFEGVAYFSVYPIDKNLCPGINPNRDVIFELYTDDNPHTAQILYLGDDASITNSNFNFNNPTIFFFHGFLEVTEHGSPDAIRKAYLTRGGHNIILVDARVLLAGPWYKIAAQNTKAVGKYAAAFIDYFVTRGLNLETVHLIGHSLGSQSAGACGHYVRSGRIPRITGLDPALPLFRFAPLSSRLDKSDAEFVDIIHTDAGVNGFDIPIGHVDFYPNGGRGTQPGCTKAEVLARSTTPILETLFCNHWRSFIYYAESVVNPNTFQVNVGGQNRFGIVTNMGYAVSKNARGVYYLKTNSEAPYSS